MLNPTTFHNGGKKLLHMSTAHITESDSRFLSSASSLTVLARADVEQGHLVWVPQTMPYDRRLALIAGGMSLAFVELLTALSVESYDFLYLEAGGPEWNGVPKFDW